MFVVLALFPWVSFGLLDLDTQPWFIIAAFALCALSFKVKADSIVVSCALLLAAAAIVSGLARMNAADFLLARGVLSYMAFSAALLGYYYYRKRFGFPRALFVAANLVWLLAGALQAALGPDVLSAVVEVRTTVGRGVTGLAPEPTFFGMVLLFLSWILLVESNYRPGRWVWLLIAVNFVYIVIAAKSAMALLFVLLLLGGYGLFSIGRIGTLLLAAGALAAMIAAVPLLNEQFPQWRAFHLLVKLAEDPLLAIRADASLNERVAHLAYSLYGVVANSGIPGGFNTFAEMNGAARAQFGGLFWYGGHDDKIMSGVGAVVYELGGLSVFFFAVTAFCTVSSQRLRLGLFHFFGFLGTFAAALPVAFPLAPILLVTMLFWRRGESYADVHPRRRASSRVPFQAPTPA